MSGSTSSTGARRGGEPVEITRHAVFHRPAGEVYGFFHDPENAQSVVPEGITVVKVSDTRSTWSARLPGGHRLHWVVEQVRDEPGRQLAWRSTDASDIAVEGEARLADVGNGTDVTLRIEWTPPPGWLGALVGRVARHRAGAAVENVLRRAEQQVQRGDANEREARQAAEDRTVAERSARKERRSGEVGHG